MDKMIENFIAKLDNASARMYAQNFFGIQFSDVEINQVLPIIKRDWREYLNPMTRERFLMKIRNASSNETVMKVKILIDKLAAMSGIPLN